MGIHGREEFQSPEEGYNKINKILPLHEYLSCLLDLTQKVFDENSQYVFKTKIKNSFHKKLPIHFSTESMTKSDT